MARVLVTGAAGFIGGHLMRALKDQGHAVVGVDCQRHEYTQDNDIFLGDLRDRATAEVVMDSIDEVYHLAADMGGIGFISDHHADIYHNNMSIDLNVFRAAGEAGVKKVFYASSACVYPVGRQLDPLADSLRECDAYPADPEDAYGWEKLMSERQLTWTAEQFGFEPRIARFHNIYGPHGTWRGGREKAPAALCRKVATAKLTGQRTIELWGDGQQVRSFMYIQDCIEGVLRLMRSSYSEPVNLGRDDAISVNDLARLIMKIAEVDLAINHDLTKPQGVRGRNSDNTKLEQVLGWLPEIDLETGLRNTYAWIESEVKASLSQGEGVV